MSGFRSWERAAARRLDAFPRVRQTAKTAYQCANYLIYGRGVPACTISPSTSILPATAWAGLAGDRQNVHTFFGYFDKSPWHPTHRGLILWHEWSGGPTVDIIAGNASEIGASRRWKIGESRAWTFQQGAMAQWLPGDVPCVIYNDVEKDRLVSRVVTQDGDTESFDWPIQVIHPSGRHGLTLNYRRLFFHRPEYGYAADVSNFSPKAALHEDGIWRIDLKSGQRELLISIEDLVGHNPRDRMTNAIHKVNHLLYSPDGSRFIFVHRWRGPTGRFSRLYVADESGHFKLLLDDDIVSHYAWLSPEMVLVWGKAGAAQPRYYIVNVLSGGSNVLLNGLLDDVGDGHPAISPSGRFLVTDTYPDRRRQQHLILVDLERGTRTDIGAFFSPLSYAGPNRCDLHPRWSPDECFVAIDSAHDKMRQLYVIDIRRLIERESGDVNHQQVKTLTTTVEFDCSSVGSFNESAGKAFDVLMSVYAGDDPISVHSALESVTEQSLPPTRIVLVVDGPIPEPLSVVCREWKDRLQDRLTIVHLEQNVGLARALNIGLTYCREEWVARMDADDFSLPHRFRDQIDFLSKNPDVDLVGGQVEEYDNSLTVLKGTRLVPTNHDDIVRFARTRNPFNHMTVMFRRSAVLAVGGYPPDLVKMQDYGLWGRMFRAGFTGANLPTVLAKVRAGHDLVGRRAGNAYFKYEVKMFSELRRSGFITTPQFVVSVGLRACTRFLPRKALTAVYRLVLNRGV